MEKEVYPKIIQMTGFCNTYLIKDNTPILIDAGVDYKGDVEVLVITHFHPDHTMFASEIKKRTGCEIIMSEESKDPNKDLLSVFPSFMGRRVNPFSIDRFVKEGDIINTENFKFEVLITPGHAQGEISLYDREKGLLFSGDVLFSHDTEGRTDFPYCDPEEMKRSVSRLKFLKKKLLLPGHGEVEKYD